MLNQGLFYFEWLATMSDERALLLSRKFDELIREQATFVMFGLVNEGMAQPWGAFASAPSISPSHGPDGNSIPGGPPQRVCGKDA